LTGIVKSFNGTFGFIQPLIGRPDADRVFFHVSAICRDKDNPEPAIPKGAEVRFDLVRSDDGRPQAANVRLETLNGNVLASEKRLKTGFGKDEVRYGRTSSCD
jgi:cold shock CspA family protein